MHKVFCTLVAMPGCEEKLRQALLKVASESRKENACVTYQLLKDKTDKGTFILYENWSSAEEHQKQFDKPYIKELANQLSDLLAEPYKFHIAEEVEDIPR